MIKNKLADYFTLLIKHLTNYFPPILCYIQNLTSIIVKTCIGVGHFPYWQKQFWSDKEHLHNIWRENSHKK